jgi:SAM-dependent methyltransferase
MRCLICQQEVGRFEDYGLPPRPGRCPHCGAKARHRELGWFFATMLRWKPGAEILEVGPSKLQAHYFLQERFLGKARYTAIDVRKLKHHGLIQAPHRFRNMSVTDMEFPDNSFDAVIFGYVLQDVREDIQAMREVFRCLKPEGFAMMNVAIDMPQTRRVPELRAEDPETYTEAYMDENGKEWAYGPDYFDRLAGVGFSVWRFPIPQYADAKLAQEQQFRPKDEFFLCFKSMEAKERFQRAMDSCAQGDRCTVVCK